MKKIFLFIILCSVSINKTFAYDVPDDLLQTEALIDWHKMQIDQLFARANKQVYEQTMQYQEKIKVSKWNQVAKEVEKRYDAAYNWLVFANDINNLRLSIQNVYNQEKSFINLCAEKVKKHPFVTVVAAQTEKMVVDRLTNITKIFLAEFGTSIANKALGSVWNNIKVSLATDKQRRDFISSLSQEITQISYALSQQSFQVRMMTSEASNDTDIGRWLDYMDGKKSEIVTRICNSF